MGAIKPLNLLDLSFVLMETRQTPMHVAGLQTFVPPPDAPRDFAKRVYEYLRSFPVTAPPFNYRLRGVGLAHPMPSFEEVAQVDLDYHLRHSALPYPGGERELGVLVSRLHSNPMDMDRPLWEIHLIEGLQGGRIALYGQSSGSRRRRAPNRVFCSECAGTLKLTQNASQEKQESQGD